MIKPRDPIGLGYLSGSGPLKASHNAPDYEELRVIEISFLNLEDGVAYVGWADMNVETGEGVLHVLFRAGDSWAIRMDSSARILRLGDYGVIIPSQTTTVLVTARMD